MMACVHEQYVADQTRSNKEYVVAAGAARTSAPLGEVRRFVHGGGSFLSDQRLSRALRPGEKLASAGSPPDV